ncbi:hypothetical protein [Morchella esculenta fusarivirus 2]|uniref:Uncharacterized protein n=1 Tax=Morchella esculenta fusarivirus 2 TaxID=2830907 RepID=A0AAE7RGA3_9VIRU|nr:hypothetical protein [Morchella esculenta fusarivirus 2]
MLDKAWARNAQQNLNKWVGSLRHLDGQTDNVEYYVAPEFTYRLDLSKIKNEIMAPAKKIVMDNYNAVLGENHKTVRDTFFTPLVIDDLKEFMIKSLPEGLGSFWFSLDGFEEIFNKKVYSHWIDPKVGLPAMSYYFELENIFNDSTVKWLIKSMAITDVTVTWSQEIYGHVQNYQTLIEAVNSMQGKASNVIKSIKSKSYKYSDRLITMACREVFKEWLQVQYIAVPVKMRFEVLQDLENYWYKNHPDEFIFKMRELQDFDEELKYKKNNIFKPYREPAKKIGIVARVVDKILMLWCTKCPPLFIVIPFLFTLFNPFIFIILFIFWWTWVFSH